MREFVHLNRFCKKVLDVSCCLTKIYECLEHISKELDQSKIDDLTQFLEDFDFVSNSMKATIRSLLKDISGDDNEIDAEKTEFGNKL